MNFRWLLVLGSDDYADSNKFNVVLDTYLQHYTKTYFSGLYHLTDASDKDEIRETSRHSVGLAYIGGMKGISLMTKNFGDRQYYRTWRIGNDDRSFNRAEFNRMRDEISTKQCDVLMLRHMRRAGETWMRDLCHNYNQDTIIINGKDGLQLPKSSPGGIIDYTDKTFFGIL